MACEHLDCIYFKVESKRVGVLLCTCGFLVTYRNEWYESFNFDGIAKNVLFMLTEEIFLQPLVDNFVECYELSIDNNDPPSTDLILQDLPMVLESFICFPSRKFNCNNVVYFDWPAFRELMFYSPLRNSLKELELPGFLALPDYSNFEKDAKPDGIIPADPRNIIRGFNDL